MTEIMRSRTRTDDAKLIIAFLAISCDKKTSKFSIHIPKIQQRLRFKHFNATRDKNLKRC